VKGNLRSRLALVGAALVLLAGCGGGNGGTSSSNNSNAGGSDLSSLSGSLKASGASFPDAYYQEVISSFKEKAPNATVTYNSVGSGTGKKEFGQGLTDFAGSDSLVKPGDGPAEGSFLYVPTVAAPITVSYHLSGVDKLQFSPDTLAKIFQTDVKKWNDPAIAADNPGVTLPNKAITVAHRSDGSGTTNNFTKYLKAASPAWKLGSGDTVAWPSGTQGAEKNTGVAQIIKQTDGAIGYVTTATRSRPSSTSPRSKTRTASTSRRRSRAPPRRWRAPRSMTTSPTTRSTPPAPTPTRSPRRPTCCSRPSTTRPRPTSSRTTCATC